MSSAEPLIAAIVAWAAARGDIAAIALVGSHARGAARADSDIDLMLLTAEPQRFRRDDTWMAAIAWPDGVTVARWQDEDWGAAWSRRLWLAPAGEVECCFAAPSWAATAPVDPGTRAVVAGGFAIRHDPEGLLARLRQALVAQPS